MAQDRAADGGRWDRPRGRFQLAQDPNVAVSTKSPPRYCISHLSETNKKMTSLHKGVNEWVQKKTVEIPSVNPVVVKLNTLKIKTRESLVQQVFFKAWLLILIF